MTKDELTSPVDVCNLNGLWVTSEHPVYVRGGWVLPKSLVAVESVFLPAIYNIELENGNSVFVNGVELITLGHSLDLDPATDAIWGRGWHSNPARARYVAVN